MRKILAVLVLLSGAPMVYAGSDTRCEPITQDMRLIGPSLFLEQMEALGLKLVAHSPSTPQVPFGHANRRWLSFKSAYVPGDRFQAYEQLRPSDHTPFAWGYALVRGQCIVGLFLARMA